MLEEKLRNIIIDKYGSVRQFSFKIDIPYTTVDSILKRGIDNSNVGNVIKMCKALDISIDNLLDSKEIIFNDSSISNFEGISEEMTDEEQENWAKNLLENKNAKILFDKINEHKNLTKEDAEKIADLIDIITRDNND